MIWEERKGEHDAYYTVSGEVTIGVWRGRENYGKWYIHNNNNQDVSFFYKDMHNLEEMKKIANLILKMYYEKQTI